MITLLFAIFFTLSIVFYHMNKRSRRRYGEGRGSNALFIISSVIAFVLLVILIFTFFDLAEQVTIDREIEMYQEENARIEKQLEVTVSNYMKYEAETFKDLKDTDAVALVSLYPELQADKLVQNQIDVYISNNAKIKELREKQIYISKAKFYIYFGR